MDTDILDGILELEDEFYREGYNVGLADGARAGYTEGSVFAVEKSFEKLLQLGRLYGKALVWNQRLISTGAGAGAGAVSKELRLSDAVGGGGDGPLNNAQSRNATNTMRTAGPYIKEEEDAPIEDTTLSRSKIIGTDICKSMTSIQTTSRLAKNIQTLLALVDPATLVLENTEDAVSDIEERLKGASLKAKLIQRALGESTDGLSLGGGGSLDADSNVVSGSVSSRQSVQTRGDGSGSIEDISSLHIRH